MMKLTNLLVFAAVMSLSGSLVAQDNSKPNSNSNPQSNSTDSGGRGGGGRGRGGNYDPAQFQQLMLDRIRDQMVVKGDDEWKIISDRIVKVMDARRGAFGGFRGGRQAGGDNNAGGGRGGFGQPSPEQEALQKAIDSKASAAEIKAALEKFRASRKEKQAALEKAQADLQKVLSLQQEAVAVLGGLLN